MQRPEGLIKFSKIYIFELYLKNESFKTKNSVFPSLKLMLIIHLVQCKCGEGGGEVVARLSGGVLHPAKPGDKGVY